MWFVAAAPGQYVPIYPIWIVGDEPHRPGAVASLPTGHRLISQGSALDSGSREKSIGQYGDRHDPYRPGFRCDR